MEWVKCRVGRPFMRTAIVVFGLKLERNLLQNFFPRPLSNREALPSTNTQQVLPDATEASDNLPAETDLE